MNVKRTRPGVAALGLFALTLPLLLAASPVNAAPKFKSLHRFIGNDDRNPMPRPLLGADGSLFGTTTGIHGGSVFQLTPPSAGETKWTETLLHIFTVSGGDGFSPWGGVTGGPNGVLYGTTIEGGSGPCTGGCGTVYQLLPPQIADRPWTESVIYNFQGGPNDGADPSSDLVLGDDGALYGTTVLGGQSANCEDGCGVVFKLLPPSQLFPQWTQTVLHSFNQHDGELPGSQLTLGPDGAVYGMTSEGGKFGFGTVFRLEPPVAPATQWNFTTLHDFKNPSTTRDGTNPYRGVILGADGAVYGTTLFGGGGDPPNCGEAGCGTVFKLTPPEAGQTRWTETQLHVFTGGVDDGAHPLSELLFDQSGALVGTTSQGGSTGCSTGCGTIFKLTPPAPGHSKWKETILHVFLQDGAGRAPNSGVIADADGVFYGTTFGGSKFGTKLGTIYKLAP